MVQITEEQGEVKIRELLNVLNTFAVHQSRYFKLSCCQQNVHVSLDFDCWEESEDERPFTVGKDCMNLCYNT